MKGLFKCNKKKLVYIAIFLISSISLTSCYKNREYDYYSDKENFISVTAEIYNISFYDENTYLGFLNLPSEFSDDHFKICAENWEIIKQNGGEDVIEIGAEITFITAPRYFGDGYVMPIVAVSIGEEILLDFDVGYENFMKKYN